MTVRTEKFKSVILERGEIANFACREHRLCTLYGEGDYIAGEIYSYGFSQFVLLARGRVDRNKR